MPPTKRKKEPAQPIDREKEAVFNELVEILKEHGLTVRRERLKQGPGWKVLSGSCRLADDKLVFVDRRLSQDEQIGFLVARIQQAKLELSPERIAALPQILQQQLALRAP